MYPIVDGQTIISTIVHELGHAGGLGHPDTDLNQIERVKEATDTLNETGNDSGFWLSIETPEGEIRAQNPALTTPPEMM